MYLKKFSCRQRSNNGVGELDIAQVRSTRDHLGLMSVVAQARDLPQPQLALEETHRLIMQVVTQPMAVELRSAAHEAPLMDATALALAIGEDVEPVLDHLVEQLGTPATAVEHDRHAPLADHAAYLLQQMRESLGQGGVDFTGNHQQRIAGAIVDPIIGGGGHGEMAARHVRVRDAALTMIGAYVTIDVQEPHEMAALGDPLARQLRAQLLSALVRGKPRELAPEGLHFRRPIQPEHPAERGRVLLLEMLGTLDA